MRNKALVAVVLLLATGYVLDLAFHGMNMANDFTYIGGIVGLALWFIFIVPLIWHWATKEKKREGQNENEGKRGNENEQGNIDSVDCVSGGSTDSQSSVHDTHRTGDGGDRSRPVGEPEGSAGHHTQDGKNLV